MTIEERLTDIEIKFAFQEDTLQALNQLIYQQQTQLEQLEGAFKSLASRIGDLSEIAPVGHLSLQGLSDTRDDADREVPGDPAARRSRTKASGSNRWPTVNPWLGFQTARCGGNTSNRVTTSSLYKNAIDNRIDVKRTGIARFIIARTTNQTRLLICSRGASNGCAITECIELSHQTP